MSSYNQYVEKHRKLILDALDYIWKHPETGYKEWKTHEYLAAEFKKLGYELTPAGNIPGFTAEVDTGVEGPTIAVFGELDALICNTHPDADPVTGAVHACGHCAQTAALLGLAAALKEPGALDGLCGKIRLVAVPSEELIEVEYREELRKQGIIKYFGGKPEFMYRGLLDGVDMAIMVHTTTGPASTGSMNGGSNGFIVKGFNFEGKPAHAGGAPHLGVNALYAANLALNAVNALRETFKDNAHIRFHPIINHGGDSVNTVPDMIKMESYVRGATMKEIVETNHKINRALAASAAALGANVHLRDIPGYWPRRHPENCCMIVKEVMEDVLDNVRIDTTNWGTGCSDMGDVGAVMPALHPFISGATGVAHGSDFRITDADSACIKSAEFQLAFLAKILKNDAEIAREIIDSYNPEFKTMQEYFDFVDGLNIDKKAVQYGVDNTIVLSY